MNAGNTVRGAYDACGIAEASLSLRDETKKISHRFVWSIYTLRSLLLIMNINWLRQFTSARFLEVLARVLFALGVLVLARALWLWVRNATG